MDELTTKHSFKHRDTPDLSSKASCFLGQAVEKISYWFYKAVRIKLKIRLENTP